MQAVEVLKLVTITMVMLVGVGCGSPPQPTATLVFTLSASPSPISGGLCAGCGAGSTERESATTITLRETGGAAGTVTTVGVVLREAGSNALIAQGEFDTADVAHESGSARLAANGTLSVRLGAHYPPSQAGKAATLTFTVRVTDDHGTVVTQTLAVTVTAT